MKHINSKVQAIRDSSWSACKSSKSSSGAETNDPLLRTRIRRLLMKVNNERRKHGVHSLKLCKRLCRAARMHNKELALTQRRLNHRGLDGLRKMDRVVAANFDASYVGECLARHQKSPEHAVDSWMKSPLHRKTVLTPDADRVGFNFKANESGEGYWAMVVAKK